MNNEEKIVYWKSVIMTAQNANIPLKQWFKENNITPSSYYKWLKRIDPTDDKLNAKALFEPITIQEADTTISLKVNGNNLVFDSSLLDKVIGALKMIINTNEIKNIYLATNFIDMRKSIDGLAMIVAAEFDLDVTEGSLFIFSNRARNRLKILYYDKTGFWLFLKKLDSGKFKLKQDANNHTRMIDQRQLSWLLDGLEIDQKYALNNTEKHYIY